MKCARSFIPYSYSGMNRTPFHPFCSQGQNEQNVANAFCANHSHSRIVNKKNALLVFILFVVYKRVKSDVFDIKHVRKLFVIVQNYVPILTPRKYNFILSLDPRLRW